jgi:hypothetical protein
LDPFFEEWLSDISEALCLNVMTGEDDGRFCVRCIQNIGGLPRLACEDNICVLKHIREAILCN